MAAGRRPFGGLTPASVVASIVSDEPVPLGRVNRAIPPAFDELTMVMLRKEPSLRPSAKEVERALAAIHESDPAEPPPASVVRRTTVGRDSQRAQLMRAYARVKQGRSLIVALTGEPGIGKTSLVEDLQELVARGESPTIARGRCSKPGRSEAARVLDLLDAAAPRRTAAGDGDQAVAPTWYLQVATPSIGESTTVESVVGRSPGPAGGVAGANEARARRPAAGDLADQPVVLFIDDLHWADISTVDL